MRKAHKVMFSAVAGLGLLLAAALTYNTVTRRTHWFWATRAVYVTIDGKPADAWVHRTRDGSHLLVTTRQGNGVSYSVYVAAGGPPIVGRCDSWVAPRLPVVIQTEMVGKPSGCVAVRRPTVNGDAKHVEFNSDDGHRLVVRW